MTESLDGGPELYRTRLIQVGDTEVLGWDFARRAGDRAPVAVTGPRAVACPRCGVTQGNPCKESAIRVDRFGRVSVGLGSGTGTHPDQASSHFERVAAMNKEVRRLKDERDSSR